MPLVHLYLCPGEDDKTKIKAAARGICQVLKEALDKPIESTRIIFHNVDEENWLVGGDSVKDRRAKKDL